MKRKTSTAISFAATLFIIFAIVIAFGTKSAGMQQVQDRNPGGLKAKTMLDDSVREVVWGNPAGADRCGCRAGYHLWLTPCPVH